MQLIKNWEQLSKAQPNDRFKITVDDCCGHIELINGYEHEELEPGVNWEYLSTHTFYGSKYKYSSELLQKYDFDIELDNWDKEK